MATEETKKCPKCKEEIAKDAKRCKHCEADLRNWFVRHKIMTAILVIIIVVFVAAAAGSGTDNSGDANKTDNNSQEAQTVTAIKVDTATFIAEFDKNQLSAEEKYKDKLVEFTAVIGNISEGITGTPFLSLKPSADELYFGTTISCYFVSKSDLTSLANGQTVTLQGTFKSQDLGIIQIEDCKIAK